MDLLTIPQRFCGPPRSGNGGWTAGALAALVLATEAGPASHSPHGAVQVTLRTPPPLDTPLAVHREEGRTSLRHETTLVCEAAPVDVELASVPLVSPEEVAAAAAAHPGHGVAEYAACFSCGTGRTEGDGLRILPGPVPDDVLGRFAAPWTPHPSTAATIPGVDGQPDDLADLPCTWAALDCVGAWADDLLDRPMLLGRMTAQVHALPRVGEAHVVVGRLLRRDGRRSFTASSLYAADGTELARAQHTWFAVDRSAYT